MVGNEDDYMSYAFLCHDVNPGISKTRELVRQHRLEDRRQEAMAQKHKKTSVLESEKRNEALSTPLSSENKGFAMLAKMGFKPGSTLGKRNLVDANDKLLHEPVVASCSKNDLQQFKPGLEEPLPLNLKLDRKGLGHSVLQKEKLQRMQCMHNAAAKKRVIESAIYQKQLKQRTLCNVASKNLRNIRSVCFELDSRMDLNEPRSAQYWPPHALALEDADNVDDDGSGTAEECNDLSRLLEELEEQISEINAYLRSRHFYCFWCAVTYESETDLMSACPGNTKLDHGGDDDALC